MVDFFLHSFCRGPELDLLIYFFFEKVIFFNVSTVNEMNLECSPKTINGRVGPENLEILVV